MKVAIAHISDLHISSSKTINTDDQIANQINRLKTMISDCSELIFAITGDIVDNGSSEQYIYAQQLLGSILDSIVADYPSLSVRFIFCPGNHDNDLSDSQTVRDTIVDSIQNKNTFDDSQIELCCSVQSNYFKFSKQYRFIDVDVSNKLMYSGNLQVDDVTINFVCINTSWLSKIKEDPASVNIPIESMLSDQTPPDRRIVVALLHHPLNWLNPKGDNTSRSKIIINKNFNIVLTGHEHTQSAGNYCDYNSDSNVLSLAAPKQNGNKSGFNLLVIDTKSLELELSQVTNLNGVYTASPTKIIPIKLRYQHNFTDAHIDYIRDLEIRVTHPAKDDLFINDIYIEPDCKVLTSIDLSPLSLPLISAIERATNPKVFFIGRDQSGKTTILKQLIEYYHSKSMYPIIIQGNDLDNANITKHIRVALKNQYIDLTYDGYMQLPKEKRVILIDNLDKSRNSLEHKKTIFHQLTSTFKTIFSTVRDTELFGATSQKYEFYWTDSEILEILPFGYYKRDLLIKKWVQLDDNNILDNDALLKHVDLIHKKVQDITVTKIPTYPFYLLMILQGMTSNSLTDYRFTAYGDCYLALIVYSINRYIGQTKSDSYINFLSYLSNHFFVQKRNQVSHDEFNEFYSYYCTLFNPPDPVDACLGNLVKAKLLFLCPDDEVRFSHPYILHFCIAKYLAKHYRDPIVKQQIADLCKRTHVPRNATILIFLTHFLDDDEFWDAILANVGDLFQSNSPETLEKERTDFLKELFLDIRDLIIEQKRDISDNRDKELKQKDKLDLITNTDDDEDIDLPDDSDEDEELDYSVLDQAQKQIRYLEIIGQILKNRSGSLMKSKIKSLLLESINSSLRLMNYFVNGQKDMMDTAVLYIRDRIKDELEKRNGKAASSGMKKQIVIDDNEIENSVKKALLSLSFSCINSILMKTALSLGSEDLLPQMIEIAQEFKFPSYKLISIMVSLEFNHALRIDEIVETKNQNEDNLYVYNVLRHLVHRFLYMHNVDYKKQQRISNEFGIKIIDQRILQLKQKTL